MSPTSSHFAHELWVGRILELARRRPLARPVDDPGVSIRPPRAAAPFLLSLRVFTARLTRPRRAPRLGRP